MPRLTTYTSQGGITTQAPGNILPLDAYSQDAKNLQAMGQTMVGLSQEWQKAKDVTDNITAKNKMMTEVQSILNEAQNFNDYQNGKDIEDKTVNLTDRLNRIMPNVLEGFTNKENAQRFQSMADFAITQNGQKLGLIMRGKTEDLFKSNFIQMQESNFNAYLVSGGDASFKNDMHTTIQEGVAGGLINRELATKMQQEIANDWEVKLIEHLAGSDPDGTMRLLKQGSFNILDSQKQPLEKRIKEIKANNHALDERLKNQQQDTVLEGFWNNIEQKISQNLPLNYDDIPDGLNGKNRLDLKKYIDNFNKSGDAETNIETWQYLYDLKTTNPQEFMNTNLIQWRASLTDADYKTFLQDQTDMKNFIPTELVEDRKLFENAAKSANVKVGVLDKETAALQKILPQYLREIEAGLKRPLKPWERESYVKRFADTMEFTSKGAREKSINNVIQGMNNETFYMRNLVQDLQAFEREKGRAATTEEKYKIIRERNSKNAIEQNRSMSEAIDFASMYGNRISSPYGLRTAPTAGASTNHKGVDVRGAMNEPFRSPVSGRVERVGYEKDGFGNFVYVRADNGEEWRFAHAAKINVKEGEQISSGDLLLSVGSTGRSTGPHTHVERWVNGQRVDPMVRGGVQIGFAEATGIQNSAAAQRGFAEATGYAEQLHEQQEQMHSVAQQPTTLASGRIRVLSPDGRPANIPENRWEEAKKQGFTRL